jgi:hypothetical protein
VPIIVQCGIEIPAITGRLDFRLIGRPMAEKTSTRRGRPLPDTVPLHHSNFAHAGFQQVQRYGATQYASTDHDNLGTINHACFSS